MSEDTKAKSLNTLLDMCKEKRKDLTEQWEKDFNMYLGKQEFQRRSKRKSNTMTNFLFSEIETIKPILTAEAPSISLKPILDTPGWQMIAEIYTKAINRIFDRNDFRARQLELVTNGLLFAHGYYKVTWDSELFGGNGDVRIDIPDTRAMFLEPEKMLPREWNFVMEVTGVDELSLLRKHPDRADDIHALFAKAGQKMKSPPTGSSKQVDAGPSASAPGAAASSSTSRFFDIMQQVDIDDPKTIELVEIWFHDDETMESMVEIVDKNGKKRKTKGTKKKYPNGKFVQFAGNNIFIEKENKFPGFPYIQFRNYFVPGEQYGMTELRQAAPIQKQYNVRNNQLYDWMNFNLGPTRFYDPRSGLDPNMITNAPNQWIPVNDAQGIKTDQPAHLNQAAFESLQKIKQEIETIFGVREVTQGTIPGDIRSGAAIEALQEAADVRLRGKSREMESSLRELTKFIVQMVTKFYIHGVHFRADHRTIESPDGEQMPVTQTPEWKEYVEGKKLFGEFFDIEIRAGVNLPRSREARRQNILELHSRRVVDDEFLLDHSQVDGKEALLERMKEIFEARQKALLAEAQAQAQGGEQVGNPVQPNTTP